MTAGMAANRTLIDAIRQRPASCERSSRSISRVEDSVNRRTRAGPVPSDLASWIPLIESPSSTVTLRSASSRCWAAVMSRRIRATRRVSQTAGGSTTSETSESRHDSAAIATAVATVVVRLDAIDVAVEVTTDCMPPMSLVMRDCTSPVRVRVKNAIDWRCRCANTSVRSPCITRWPTWVLIQVCTTPSTDVTAATATMPAVSRTSRRRSCWGSAVSITARSRNGEARPTTDAAAMIATTTRTEPRYGVKSRAIRRSETSRACCFSAAVGLSGVRKRPRPALGAVVESIGTSLKSVGGNSVRLPHHEVTTPNLATLFPWQRIRRRRAWATRSARWRGGCGRPRWARWRGST